MVEQDKKADAVAWWNTKSGFHPLTCAIDSNHELMEYNTQTGGLRCPTCGWKQHRYPDMVLNAYNQRGDDNEHK